MNYKQIKGYWLKHCDFMVLDIFCVQLALLISYVLRFGLTNPYAQSSDYRRLVVFILFSVFLVIFFGKPYSNILKRGYVAELKSVISNSSLLMVILIVIMYLTKESSSYSRIMLVSFYFVNIVVVYLLHIIWKGWLKRCKSQNKYNKATLLVTERQYADDCIEWFFQNQYGPFRLSGVVLLDGQMDIVLINGMPIVAGRNDVISYCQHQVVDDVFFYAKNYDISDLMRQLTDMGIVVHSNVANLEETHLYYQFNTMNGIMFLTASMKSAEMWQIGCKRLMDILGGLVGLLLAGVIALVIAPIIKIQSPGSVFFSQLRVGKNGRKFKIYKFRSMYADAEERKKELMAQNKMSGHMFKIDNDPRVFPFGHLIRRTSLDEFPQFLNVLKGDMSLCGTRPPTVDEYEQYAPHHKSRLAIKPGLTGLWQVSGRSDITDFEEVVRLDNEYIRNWSLSLDIKIIFKTLLVVIKRCGAG